MKACRACGLFASGKRGWGKQGFTLMETVVASAVLIMFFAAVSIIVQIILEMVGESRVRAVASLVAETKMERVRNLTYTDVGTVGGIPQGVLEQNEQVVLGEQTFNVETRVFYVDDPFDGVAPVDSVNTDYKRVKVEVSWGGAFESKNPLVMVTDVSPKGLESDVGGGTLALRVIDAQGDPITGASVAIYNDQVLPTIDLNINTDNQGRVTLPGSPICNECYQVTVSKGGLSTDRTYGSSEVTNPSRPHLSTIESEVTESTFSIDSLASISFATTGSRFIGYPPFAGVEFELRGSKVIGTDEFDEPVYKYREDIVSGAGGLVSVNNLEWDLYSVKIPATSSVDMAGIVPLSPFSLLPGQNRSVKIVTQAGSVNSLLVAVTNAEGSLIPDADVTLVDLQLNETDGVTGGGGLGDQGQVLFGNLLLSEYGIIASKSGYLSASSSAVINGDTKATVVIQEN